MFVLFYIQLFSYFRCKYVIKRSVQFTSVIGRKSWFFHTPLHSTPPLGGPRRNTAIPFGTGKLEWWGYPKVKIEDMYNRLD